ncbi:MAG: AraC family transcriptional regulator [Butyricicoccus sp.]
MFHVFTVPVSAEQNRSEQQGRMCYLVDVEVDGVTQANEIHKHSDITEIGIVYTGHGLHTIGGVEYHSEPGDILLYNVGQLHHDQSLHVGEMTRFYLCGIQNLNLEDLPLRELVQDSQNCLLKGGEYADFLIRGFELAKMNLQEKGPHTAELAQSFARSLLSVISVLAEGHKRHADGPKEPERSLAEEIRAYIDRNYAKNFSLEELAEQFHVNRYHIAHVFSDAFQCSPMQYRTRRRIGESQVLLVETDFNITYIASMVGYDDPNWFTQSFSKMVGMSPSKYRKLSVRFQEDPAKK